MLDSLSETVSNSLGFSSFVDAATKESRSDFYVTSNTIYLGQIIFFRLLVPSRRAINAI